MCRTTPHCRVACLLVLSFCGCAGMPPHRDLVEFYEAADLETEADAIVVDIDDTIYDRERDLPMPGAAEALHDLAEDHLIVYLTARPTHFRIPGLTANRDRSVEFLERHGFPKGPLFTSSLWNILIHGQGGGKYKSFEQLAEFGVHRIALAVGDRAHDLEAYRLTPDARVLRTVTLLIEEADELDPERDDLDTSLLNNAIDGDGSAWARIVQAFRDGRLPPGSDWVVSERRA